MRGPWENNSPFGGHFGPQFAGMGRPPFGCPFRGDSSDHHSHKPSFGPFGKPRFDHSPERHCHREPEPPRWGPFEHGHRGCGRRGPSEYHCCGASSRGRRHERGCHSPRTDRPHPWFGRNADQHYCGCRGRPSSCSECSCRPRCEGTCGFDHCRSECCHHASTKTCNHRRPCHDNSCEGRSRHSHCGKCCESEPCCCANKEDRERDDSLERQDSEPENERENKMKLVVLWLLRELFWKTIKGRHLSDSNMEIIITSTRELQRSLELETDIIVTEDN